MAIVSLDIETTGLNKDECGITQISMIKFDEIRFKVISTFNTYLKPRATAVWHPEATNCSHITPEMVENAPSIKSKAQEIIDFIGDCDILTYNGNTFDLPFLKEELRREGFEISFLNRTVYDSYQIECTIHPRNLGALYKTYTGETMEEAGLTAHNSLSDAQATIEVFKNQGDLEALKEICKNNTYGGTFIYRDGIRCFGFGKHKNIPVAEVIKNDPQWVSWLIKTKKDRDVFSIIKEEYTKVKNL